MAMKGTLDEDVPVLDDKVTVDLTGLASLTIGDGVRNHLRNSQVFYAGLRAWVRVGELHMYCHELL